jgi:hypothetical protein
VRRDVCACESYEGTKSLVNATMWAGQRYVKFGPSASLSTPGELQTSRRELTGTQAVEFPDCKSAFRFSAPAQTHALPICDRSNFVDNQKAELRDGKLVKQSRSGINSH